MRRRARFFSWGIATTNRPDRAYIPIADSIGLRKNGRIAWENGLPQFPQLLLTLQLVNVRDGLVCIDRKRGIVDAANSALSINEQ
ncbi:MAG TPA: hypothetical protein PK472_15960, partial [Pseudomonadota bacterium]|nr:hypothetical protein [Pseudomonadota bacterium]